VDEKGRLKLPAPFQQYLGRLGEQKVFITSFDVRTARIYPISVWRDNEKFFDDFAEDPEIAEDVAFTANDLGADSELDGQGRLLVPQELRRSLGIENQPVWLDCYRGRINVYSKQVYEERKSRASQGLAEKVRALEKKGLK
jgi:MraZ protein